MMLRLVALLGLFGALLSAAPHAGIAARGDLAVLHGGSVRASTESPLRAEQWLRRQPEVQHVTILHDGRTLAVRFRDGERAYILPRLGGARGMVLPLNQPLRAGLRPLIRAAAPGAQAIVLEPYASELNIGAKPGDPEVTDLQNAGFTVTLLYDTSVTPMSFVNLSRYNVVYLQTHSGTDAGGIVGTGEPVNGDPAVQPYLNDGTVIPCSPAGETNPYYCITPSFVRQHMGTFAPHSVFFVNGCALPSSTPFIQALDAQGVGVTITWNNDVNAYDGYLSAAALFNQLDSGLTVSAALQSLYAAGYGKSVVGGQTSTLGFQGDGSITLQEAGGSPGATSTPVPPTSTPIPPTATPQPTKTSVPPTARPTKTPIPPRATTMPTLMPAPSPTPIVPASASASLVTLVKPGGDQSIVVNGAKPGREIHLQVTFPNGDKLQQAAAADGIGNANFSFLQRPSMITRRNRQARVTLTGVGAGGPFSMVKTYTIGYAPVDVSVQPRTARPGKQVSIWIHGHKRAGIVLTLTLAGNHHRYITSRTGSHGWTRIGYTVPRRLHSGQHIAVHVFLYIFHRTAQTTSTLHIR